MSILSADLEVDCSEFLISEMLGKRDFPKF